MNAPDPAPDLDAFRARCRAFLDEPVEQLDGNWATGIAFQRRLFDAGLAGLTVPTIYGGQGLAAEYDEVLQEEAAGHHLPTGVFRSKRPICSGGAEITPDAL